MSQRLLNNTISISTIISLTIAALSIKMLDDYIDENKRDYIPYIFCFLCISISLHKDSATLLLSSYITGMFHDINLRLISKLKTYHEQIIIFVISILIFGFNETLYSLILIVSIQLIDDLIDERLDKYEGKKNWAVIMGKTETIILAGILLTLLVKVKMYYTISCIVIAFIISIIFNMAKRKNLHN